MKTQLLLCGLLAVATYYTASLIQTLFHWFFGHTRRVGAIRDVHVGGHHAHYRARLVSERWIASERHVMWYYAIPFAPMLLAAFVFLPLAWFLAHGAALAWTIWWHIYLHRQYHLRGTWLARFAWFRRKRALHFIHHRNEQSNFAIVEFVWDRLLGTCHSPQLGRATRKGRTL